MRTGLPASRGGLWRDLPSSTRGICEIYRALARGDSSLALTTSMHPAVLAFWLATPEVPEPDADMWRRQRDTVFDGVEKGASWGTITSEPGSGGDVSRTRTVATRSQGDASGEAWRLTGQKHFGSGTGVTSYMLTTAIPDGEDEPDWFYVPVAGNPLDGSEGITLVAPWDGHGMAATQSHALAFDGAPAVRFSWPGHLRDLIDNAAPFIGTLFTAVVLGIVEEAVDTARHQLAPRAAEMRAYEQVEWAQAELEAWTMAQVYERHAARHRVGTPRGRRRDTCEDGGRPARRVVPGPAVPGAGRWHVLAALALRPLVRGCAGARLPAPALGAGLRGPGRRLVGADHGLTGGRRAIRSRHSGPSRPAAVTLLLGAR